MNSGAGIWAAFAAGLGSVSEPRSLDEDEIVAAGIEAERYDCERDFAEFVRSAWKTLEPETPLIWSSAQELVCLTLQKMFREWQTAREDLAHSRTPVQKCRNLNVNIIPGSAKSTIVSVMFPAWVWTQVPWWRPLCLSTNPRVVNRDSAKFLKLVTSDWYQTTFSPTWAITSDALSSIKNSAGGARVAFGFQATIVGDRGHALLIDDANDPAKADHEVDREAVKSRYDTAIGNRLNDLRVDIRVNVQQRVHEDDLTGHLKRKGWASLELPAEFDPDMSCETPYGDRDTRTERGELLDPVRFPADVLAAERARLGTRGYAGQYQQKPGADDGNRFKLQWWRWYRPACGGPEVARPRGASTAPAVDEPANFREIILSLDANSKETKDGSRASLTAHGVIGQESYLLAGGIWAKSVEYTELLQACKRMIRLMRTRYGTRVRIRLIVEPKANGHAILDSIKRWAATEHRVVVCEIDKGRESKGSMAALAEPEVEAGLAYLPENEPGVEDWLHEHTAFPGGRHDDHVDGFTQLRAYIRPDTKAETAKASLRKMRGVARRLG